jgi:PAS domain S-box-containing protein
MKNTKAIKRYLDLADVIILVVGADERVRLINRKGCETLGCSEHEILGTNWFDCWLPQRIRESIRNAFHELLRQERNLEFFENPVLSRSGEERLIAWRNAFVRDRKGRIQEVISTGEDVTQRRKTEMALIESEATLRAILETCVDGIITIDESGRILSFNPAAVRIFGYRPEEVLGQEVGILMPEPFRHMHQAYIDHHLATRETRIIGLGREVTGRRKDGSLFPLYLAVSDVSIRGRKMFTGIVRDLTDFKRLQEEIIQSQKLAAIGEMAASVGHEIKNPLAGISGAIEILKDTLAEDDARRQIMNDILSEVRRLDNTVRDLLAFSRPWNPDAQLCKLHEIAERVARSFQEQEELADLSISLENEAQSSAMVDPWLFEKVLWNLLDNASDAMGGNGEIRLRFSDGPGYVQMVVEDSGTGIPPEHLKDVFRPFFTTKNRGTGLGLAICKKIMDAHGGAITLTSTPHKGTRVTLQFPSGERQAPRPAHRRHSL